jgi:hypothetical protein
MVTTTTSPLDARLPPSKTGSDPLPPKKAPPWIQSITGLSDPLLLFVVGKYGV